eukprot:GEMP01054248.1.p1 GENE.GEMP01054248.1~~GEMP01054248.1.p1  ORF type:complete len:397 (+),score=96.49 GEMP01054248.1:69-1193(+)
MFMRARLDRLKRLRDIVTDHAKRQATKKHEVDEITSRVVDELERSAPQSVHGGFRNNDIGEHNTPDAYVDSLLAMANAPMHGDKVASSTWGNDGTPISALPWIMTRRKKRDRFDALHALRRRPFYMPTIRQMGWDAAESSTKKMMEGEEAMASTVIKEDVVRNKERLGMLWKVSASHGVSWDELDCFYVQFHNDSEEASRDLHQGSPTLGDKKDPHGHRYEALQKQVARYRKEQRELIRRKIHDRLDRGIADWNIYTLEKGGNRVEQEIELAVNSRLNRLAKTKLRKMLRTYKQRYAFGQLTYQLRDFVLDKMAQREAHERARGLATERDVASILKRARKVIVDREMGKMTSSFEEKRQEKRNYMEDFGKSGDI